MAITVNIPEPTVDLDTSIGTVLDSSVYSSPTRASVGVFVKVYKLSYDGVKTYLPTAGASLDPELDASWTFEYSEDGWILVNYISIPDYNGATNYSIYDAAFDPTTKLVYSSKSSGNSGNALSNTTFWQLVTNPTDLVYLIGSVNQPTNVLNTQGLASLYYIINPYVKRGYGTLAGDAFLEASTTYRRTQDVRLHELVGLGIIAIDIAKARLEYSRGELFCRKATNLINNVPN